MTESFHAEKRRHCTVLVVEDEAMIRMMLADELNDAGFEVIEAENADEAVVRLEGAPDVRIVITDVRMPGTIDGLGLATWMREHRPAIPIIVTSGFATPPDIAAINPCVARLVAKPYLPRTVISHLFDILALHKTALDIDY